MGELETDGEGCRGSERHPRNRRWPWRRMTTLLLLGGALLVGVSTREMVHGQAGGGGVPANLGCEAECPGVGTDVRGMRQTLSPVSNSCEGTALQLLLDQLDIEVELPADSCPAWVVIEPERRLPTQIDGCCLISREDLPVFQQKMRCRCTRRFLVCWDQDCLPDGEAVQLTSVASWVASPCAGGQGNLPCNRGR